MLAEIEACNVSTSLHDFSILVSLGFNHALRIYMYIHIHIYVYVYIYYANHYDTYTYLYYIFKGV